MREAGLHVTDSSGISVILGGSVHVKSADHTTDIMSSVAAGGQASLMDLRVKRAQTMSRPRLAYITHIARGDSNASSAADMRRMKSSIGLGSRYTQKFGPLACLAHLDDLHQCHDGSGGLMYGQPGTPHDSPLNLPCLPCAAGLPL